MTQAPYTWLVPLPVVLPLIGAGVTLVLGNFPRAQRLVSTMVLAAVLVVAGGLVWAADAQGSLVVEAGGWQAPWGVVLVVDRLAALMVLVSVIVTFGVLLYSIGQGRSGEDETDAGSPLPIFHPTLMVLMAGVATTFISGDLFHVYVGFEMLLVASFVLLTLGGSAERVRAGVNYVFVSLLSSMLFLLAIALVYAATGTVTLAQLGPRLDDLPDSTRLVLQLLLLLGFCVKAAVFPMSGWLPDSYPTAPAPVTAVFAGLLTKVGVYAVIRTQTLLFPDDRIDTLLMWAALATMLVGILGAIAQTDIKRLLSFTLVSHIGYLLFGISVGNEIGLSAAIFYVAHHILIQTTLFLVVGLVEWRAGSTSLNELGGLARTSPLIAILFFIPAMNLAGIPPFSGFLGKVGLMQGGADQGTTTSYVLIAGAALTSLLTLYAVSRVWARAFWRRPASAYPAAQGPPPDPSDGPREGPTEGPTMGATPGGRPAGRASVEAASNSANPAGARAANVIAAPEPTDRSGRALTLREVPRGMVAPTALLVVLGVAISVFAGPLFDYTDRAAHDLRTRTPYIEAVFPGGVP